MKSSTRWATLIVILLIALSCYLYGSTTGMMAFIIAGALFELAFWIGLFSSDKKTSSGN